MCEACGCNPDGSVSVDVHRHALVGNDRAAEHNREHFAERGIVAVNLMGAPGSGRTAVLEATARAMSPRRRLGAISGAVATDRDAQRLRAVGIPAESITTGSACHLDAELVHRALHHVTHAPIEYLFIENIGNLVCSALYDLGQRLDVVTLSVAEGEDTPLKYPVMFRKADLVLLTKIDLLPHLPEVRVAAIEAALAQVMPMPLLIPVSARTGEGVDRWVAWLETVRPAAARGHSHHATTARG